MDGEARGRLRRVLRGALPELDHPAVRVLRGPAGGPGRRPGGVLPSVRTLVACQPVRQPGRLGATRRLEPRDDPMATDPDGPALRAPAATGRGRRAEPRSGRS